MKQYVVNHLRRITSVALCVSMLSTIGALPAGAVELGTKETKLDTSEYEISNEMSYVWDDSYVTTLTITNTGDSDITNWSLKFPLDTEIIRLGNAQILDQSDGQYTIGCLATDDVIKSSQSVMVDIFIAGDPSSCPSSFQLNGTIQNHISGVEIIPQSTSLQFQDTTDGGFYVLTDKLDGIAGEITGLSGIESLGYRVEDENKEIVAEGVLSPSDNWDIDDLGLHIGYNKLSFWGNSESGKFDESIEIVNFNEENTKPLGVDLEIDSDADRVPDYFEERLGLDPQNPHSISTALDDSAVILKSLGVDSDTVDSPSANKVPVVEDNIPSELLRAVPEDRVNITGIVIHRSKRPEGCVEGGKTVAPDLTFNDYTYEQLCKLGKVFAVAKSTPEVLIWGEMSAVFAAGGVLDLHLASTLTSMVDLFKSGNTSQKGKTVGVRDKYDYTRYKTFNNATLTNAVKDHSATQKYTKQIADYVTNYLKNGGDPKKLLYVTGGKSNIIEKYVNSFDTTPYPSYGVGGLGIAIHGWHGHTISLNNYKESARGFSGTLVFHFYDHFGLDNDDEITNAGFCDWFTLQHYDRFNGAYVPFLTICNISVNISGPL